MHESFLRLDHMHGDKNIYIYIFWKEEINLNIFLECF
jgi:hypothetical protein